MAKVCPSGEKATARTGPLNPVRLVSIFPVITSQSFTVASALPVASLLPSGEIANDKMLRTWPVSVMIGSRFSMSHTLTSAGNEAP